MRVYVGRGDDNPGKLWVRTDGWDRRDDLAELELVKNRGLARRVKPNLCERQRHTCTSERASVREHILYMHVDHQLTISSTRARSFPVRESEEKFHTVAFFAFASAHVT